MYLSIIILPLLGSIVSGLFGRKTGVTGAQIVTSLSVLIVTIFSIIAFFEVGFNNSIILINLFKWIDSEWFNMLWAFHFDSLTVSMLIPVLVISSLVHIYSVGYMNGDPHNQRFFSYLSLFTFMMIILVTANNYLLMFVGWEGVGVCSYLLVSFWFTRIAANQSSISAFLTNRIGDCFLTIGMFVILWSLGNLDYSTVFSLAPYINENIITIIGVCLLIGAMAKSSQIGLHVWLPMAMEGPTPVSALIHAATMVTAGVYLLMRSSPLIEYSSTLLLLCLWLGAITTVFSSLIGLFQQDIKKVIAYSTMSQLGMMVIAIGLSSYNVALFHLINHAFYKGLLFLGAGAVIHAVADNQDFRKYGGLINFLPLSYSVILIASLSLVAFPFMTGFYSKDFILESAYGQYSFNSIAVYTIAVIGAIFTTLYSVKVIYLTFIANPNGSRTYYKHAHESDIFISLPLVILALFSIFFGYFTKEIFLGLGSSYFIDNSMFIHPIHEIMINTEFGVSSLFKLLPFIFTILFSIIAIIFSEFLPESIINFKLSKIGRSIFGFFNQRFLVEMFYNKYITNPVLHFGEQTTKVLDKGSIELLGPYGLEKGIINLSKNITNLNKGIVTTYALFILVGLIIYLNIFSLFFINFSLIILLSLFLLIILSSSNSIINNNLESNFLNLNFYNYLKIESYYLINTKFLSKHYSYFIFAFICLPFVFLFITNDYLINKLFITILVLIISSFFLSKNVVNYIVHTTIVNFLNNRIILLLLSLGLLFILNMLGYSINNLCIILQDNSSIINIINFSLIIIFITYAIIKNYNIIKTQPILTLATLGLSYSISILLGLSLGVLIGNILSFFFFVFLFFDFPDVVFMDGGPGPSSGGPSGSGGPNPGGPGGPNPGGPNFPNVDPNRRERHIHEYNDRFWVYIHFFGRWEEVKFDEGKSARWDSKYDDWRIYKMNPNYVGPPPKSNCYKNFPQPQIIRRSWKEHMRFSPRKYDYI
jgi:NADH-ubiquinone oxidoreductase chain 5